MQIETTQKENNALHYRRLKLPAQRPTRTSQAIPEHIPDVKTLHVPQYGQGQQHEVLRVQDVLDNPSLLTTLTMREQYASWEQAMPIATPLPPPVTPLPQPIPRATHHTHHMLPPLPQPIERAAYYPPPPAQRTVEGAIHYSQLPSPQPVERAIQHIPPWVPPPPTRPSATFILPTPEEQYHIDLGTILLVLFGAAFVILLYLIVPVLATVVPFFSSVWGYIIVTLELIGFGELLVCHVLLKTTKR